MSSCCKSGLGENCRVEWPQSAPIRVTRPISFSDVQLQTRSQSGDWFSVTGEVQVNEQLTVTFQNYCAPPATTATPVSCNSTMAKLSV